MKTMRLYGINNEIDDDCYYPKDSETATRNYYNLIDYLYDEDRNEAKMIMTWSEINNRSDEDMLNENGDYET
jgi:hypothetical protein